MIGLSLVMHVFSGLVLIGLLAWNLKLIKQIRLLRHIAAPNRRGHVFVVDFPLRILHESCISMGIPFGVENKDFLKPRKIDQKQLFLHLGRIKSISWSKDPLRLEIESWDGHHSALQRAIVDALNCQSDFNSIGKQTGN